MVVHAMGVHGAAAGAGYVATAMAEAGTVPGHVPMPMPKAKASHAGSGTHTAVVVVSSAQAAAEVQPAIVARAKRAGGRAVHGAGHRNAVLVALLQVVRSTCVP